MKSYNKSQKETVVRSSNAKPQDIKVIILINENSASASEIFAAAMRDNKKAKLIGTTTFGKGVMQEVIEIATGGALKVTIEEFKTPNGDVINKKGVSPDIAIKETMDDKEDKVLNKAIELLKK